MASPRNKTLRLSETEKTAYLTRCLRPCSPMTPEEALDQILCGDTFQSLPLLPRSTYDLVVADPPYNLNKDFDGSTFRRMDAADYLDYTRRWLDLARPLLRPDGSIYVCCDWRCSAAVETALSERFIVRNRITWQREKGRGAAKNWKNTMEDIWFATVGRDYTFHLDAVRIRRRVLAPYRQNGEPKDWTQDAGGGKYRDTCPGNLWDDLTVPYWSMPENTPHPTQKPEKLLARLLLASTDPGGTVLDPFLGSGTAAVTAKKLGRRYTGVERNPLYCALAEKRLELAEADPRIQGFADGVFWERNARP